MSTRIAGFALVAAVVLLLTACSKEDPLYATVTLKSGSGQFSGKVMRREAAAITLQNQAGETRTFTYGELTDIQYGTGGNSAEATAAKPPEASAPRTGPPTVNLPAPTGDAMHFPAGTQFPVRTQGLLDSCCVGLGTISVGVLDENINSPAGKPLLPAGAVMVMSVRDQGKNDGALYQTFELVSAEFGGHRYAIVSDKGGTEAGITFTATGAKDGTKDAVDHGVGIHLNDHAYMGFKAVTSVTLHPSL